MFMKSMLSAAVVFGLAFASAASADVEYDVYYSEPSNGPVVVTGDVHLNGKPYAPPSWACGLRVVDPDEIYWIHDYIKDAIPLPSTVDAWLPYDANCPSFDLPESEQGILIRLRDEPQTTYPVQDSPKSTITSSVASGRWFDRLGVARGCNCLPPNLPIRNSLPVWHAMPVLIASLKTQIVDPLRQTRAYATAQQHQATVDALAADLSAQIAARRRTNLGDLETTVRSLEDTATAQLSDASTQLAIAARYARSGDYAEAHLAADLAGGAFGVADAFAEAVQYQIDNADAP